MSSVAEIQQAIVSLTKSDYAELMHWLAEYDWDQWDKQIEADSETGKLDFLLSQAEEARGQGKLEDL